METRHTLANGKQTQSNSPNRGWDRLAAIYSALEYLTLGRTLQASRFALIDHLIHCETILLLGDGNGRFLAGLLERGCKAKIISVDLSQGMLNQARQRIESQGLSSESVAWLQSDLRNSLPVDERFDAIVCQYFFDNFNPGTTAEIAGRLHALTHSDTRLLVSEFSHPDELTHPKKIRQRCLLWSLYHSFRLLTGIEGKQFPHLNSILPQEGWERTHSWSSGSHITESSIWKPRKSG